MTTTVTTRTVTITDETDTSKGMTVRLDRNDLIDAIESLFAGSVHVTVTADTDLTIADVITDLVSALVDGRPSHEHEATLGLDVEIGTESFTARVADGGRWNYDDYATGEQVWEDVIEVFSTVEEASPRGGWGPTQVDTTGVPASEDTDVDALDAALARAGWTTTSGWTTDGHGVLGADVTRA